MSEILPPHVIAEYCSNVIKGLGARVSDVWSRWCQFFHLLSLFPTEAAAFILRSCPLGLAGSALESQGTFAGSRVSSAVKCWLAETHLSTVVKLFIATRHKHRNESQLEMETRGLFRKAAQICRLQVFNHCYPVKSPFVLGGSCHMWAKRTSTCRDPFVGHNHCEGKTQPKLD